MVSPVTRLAKEGGGTEYHLEYDSAWDGFDSFVKYLKKYWHAVPIESDDKIYSRRWVLRSGDVSISVYHDSQIGNYFLREDGGTDLSLLEAIKEDLEERFSN